MKEIPDWLEDARRHWRWRGGARPAFATVPGPGQVSVWDFPRPPRLVPDTREVRIRWQGVDVACTQRATCLLETSHPPTFYIPWDDVDRSLLLAESGSSFCEWKGPARYWTLQHGGRRLERIAWSYPQPLQGAESIADSVAFYAKGLDCCVDGAAVQPQPGGFYGGWITPELTGPFKGDTGSEGW